MIEHMGDLEFLQPLRKYDHRAHIGQPSGCRFVRPVPWLTSTTPFLVVLSGMTGFAAARRTGHHAEAAAQQWDPGQQSALYAQRGRATR